MDRRSYLKNFTFLAGGVLMPAGVMSWVGRAGMSHSPDLCGFDGKIMGTGYSVRIAANFDTPASNHSVPDNHDRAYLAESVHSELRKIDALMSTWRVQSEVSRFNYSNDTDWQALSDASFLVVEQAFQSGKQSSGAYDVTVAPLVDLWGFGPRTPAHTSSLRRAKPSEQAICHSRAQVGYQFLDIDYDARAIRKKHPLVKLDLSGIAKGYAVDQIHQLLHRTGHENILVELGGELRSNGTKSDAREWRVAIERPGSSMRDAFRVINLAGNAVATSGDYRNFFLHDGVRYSHAIDPRTGKPVAHELASVSVVAKTAMQADAHSTAIMVLGPSDGWDYAAKHGLAMHMIVKNAHGHTKELFTESFSKLLLEA